MILTTTELLMRRNRKYKWMPMFKAEKTYIFWIGLSILGVASIGLVTMLWLIFFYYPANYHRMHWDYPTLFPTYFWQFYVWQILGAFALIFIGLFMMKSGTKKKSQVWRMSTERNEKQKRRTLQEPI